VFEGELKLRVLILGAEMRSLGRLLILRSASPSRVRPSPPPRQIHIQCWTLEASTSQTFMRKSRSRKRLRQMLKRGMLSTLNRMQTADLQSFQGFGQKRAESGTQYH
jgi:hypothetical protein